MAETRRYHNGTNQVECNYSKVPDAENQATADAWKQIGQFSTRRRFRRIGNRKSRMHTKNGREKSISA